MSLENDVLGFIAAFLTTTAFVPQAYMVWRTDNTEGVSLTMYGMTVVGIALWLAYGIVTHSMPLMISCSCTFVMSSYILSRKIRHSRMPKIVPVIVETVLPQAVITAAAMPVAAAAVPPVAEQMPPTLAT